MTVFHYTPNGCLVDQENCACFTYQLSKLADARNCSAVKLMFSTRFFHIRSPFMMDTQFDAQVRRQQTKHRKKRKVNVDANDPLELRHAEIEDYLKTAMYEMVKFGAENGFFERLNATSTYCLPAINNNVEARTMAALLSRHVRLMSELNCWTTTTTSNDRRVQLPNLIISGSVGVRGSLASIVVTHLTGSACTDQDQPCYLQLGKDHDHVYLLPPRCTFLMSDATLLRKFANSVKPFDLIVMDPPWYNKSVKRQKSYQMMDHYQIKEIPLRQLANDGCLVAVWTTNNDTCLTFVRDELFPIWGLTFVAEWHWLKFTSRGETICDLESNHKKPYEHLIIGQRRSTDVTKNIVLQNHRVICSVPSSLHSHKPPLHELLTPLLREGYDRCLELFSRYLLPGWTSWGNETLLFQHTDFYDVCDQ